MPFINLPRVEWLAQTNLNQNYRHSIAISLLRGLAAVQVLAAHMRAQLYPSLKSLPDPSLWYQALSFFTGFAHQAVVVFFLLSGWLVGGSLLNKLHERHALLSYAIDRVTRLWIVLAPAFLLTLALAVPAGTVDPLRVDFSRDNPFSASAFAGNLVGLQDLAVPRYGGNFALWSLTYETWYYVLFPLAVVSVAAGATIAKLAAAAIALLIAWILGPVIMLYFCLWLMGLAFSRIKITVSPGWLAFLAAAFGAVAVFFRLTGHNNTMVIDSFAQDAVFSVAFLLLLCSLQEKADQDRMATRLAACTGAWLAAFSFTLYVIHVPLLLAMRSLLHPFLHGERLSPHSAAHFAIYAAMLAAIVLLAWLWHLPFEAQTYRLRRRVKALATPARMR